MTPEEKKKAIELISIAQKKGNDADLLLLDKINELKDEMEKMRKEHEAEMAKMPEMMKMMPEIPKEIGVEIKGAELITIKGEKGDAGEKGGGEKGEKGIQGIKGEKGEKGERGNNGTDGERGIQGEKGKDGSPDTGEQIRDKLEILSGDERLKMSAIKGLEEMIKAIPERPTTTIFGPGKTKIWVQDLSSQLNGVLKTFKIGTHYGIISVQASSAPFGAFREFTDYNEVGNTIVFTSEIDAAVSLAAGQSLIIKVLK